MTPPPRRFAGHEILETIHEGRHSIVHRARSADGRPVILKVLRQERPSPERIARFRLEFEMTAGLDIEGVVDARALEVDDHRWYMVLEDIGATSLARRLAGDRLEIGEVLEIGARLARILGEVHSAGLVHRDVNPSNVVACPSTGALQLIDFGISSRLTRETRAAGNPDSIEATLAYASPEQTGRMNREIDYRTDYYSLGATLHHLLVGEPPFATIDPMELVHAHIARPVEPLVRRRLDIPEPVSDIVLKLLAKNAEDRYQSTSALAADLEECRRQLDETGAIAPIALAAGDAPERFQIPQHLYGREAETGRLLEAFERASAGTAEVLLVSGTAGVGKSSLVEEIHKPVTARRGIFILGKFDQFGRDVPYASLLQALRTLIRQILTESEGSIDAWRRRILGAVGRNGRLLTEAIAELQTVIGPQPAVVELPPAEAENRFHNVLLEFIRLFAAPGRPLVLFLDDLQWADAASLHLLRRLVIDPRTGHVLLLGAYRDNEIGEGHPLAHLLSEVAEENVLVHEIVLAPLDAACVGRLTADALGGSVEDAADLARLLEEKTGGNPFFLKAFLHSLDDDGLIVRTAGDGRTRWTCDTDEIRRRAMTDNVVELMAARIERLEERTRSVLETAAAIGDTFDLATLAVVCERPAHRVAEDLWEPLSSGLILAIGDEYRLAALDVEGLAEAVDVRYRFAHDRIQQAAYARIPESERARAHGRIGLLLLRAAASDADREEAIFEIVGHLNRGAQAVTSVPAAELARLNLQAARRAKASAAHASTFHFARQGLAFLTGPDPGAWPAPHELTLALHDQAAEAAFILARFDEMDRHLEAIDRHAAEVLERTHACEIRVLSLNARNRPRDAVETALAFMAELGRGLPLAPGTPRVLLEILRTRLALAGTRTASLFDRPALADRRLAAALRIGTHIQSSAYIVRPELFAVLVCRQVRLLARHGNTPEGPVIYGCYGLLLAGLIGDVRTANEFGDLSLRLLEAGDMQVCRAKTLQIVYSFIRPWVHPLSESIEPLHAAFEVGRETGELEFSSWAAHIASEYALISGRPLARAADQADRYAEAIASFGQRMAANNHESYRRALRNLVEAPDEPWRIDGRGLDVGSLLAAGDRMGTANFLIARLILASLFERHEEAEAIALEGETYLDSVIGLGCNFAWTFHDALTALALAGRRDRTRLARARKGLRRLRRWARHGPTNHRHKVRLVEAELARVTGRPIEARTRYDEAIAAAREVGFLHEEALALELAGRFHLASGDAFLARYHFQEAHYAYRRWGAEAKVRHLEEGNPDLLLADARRTPPTASVTTSTATGTAVDVGTALDLESVLRAARAVSGEIQLASLLEKVLRVLLENAGATRGCLLLERGGSLEIEASAVATADRIDVEVGRPEERRLPESIVNFACRTRETVVLGDAGGEGLFADDPYFARTSIPSVLTLPLVHQGHLVGLLYLENAVARDAFTAERLEVLHLLASQIATSVENARLYADLEGYSQTLEARVRERTAQLSRARSDAVEASRAKSQFLANMSHELRTPLNAIIGYSQMLQEASADPGGDPSTVGDLERIERAGEHLLGLINSVLDLSKVEAGQMTLDVETFDAGALVDEVRAMIVPLAEKGRNELVVRSPGDLGRMTSDATKVRQCLFNLLSNACKFTSAGRVELEASREADDGGDRIVFRVSDTGIGMSAEELERIFEPFGQAQPSTHRRFGGTGLGLTITRQFAELMGGSVDVLSEEGAGTTFTVRLPVEA